MAWEGLFVAGTFDGFALDFLGGAKVDDFLLDLVEVVLIHAKTLHHHGCFVLGCLAKLPGDNSEGHTIVFKHVHNTVEDSFVEQVPYQLESESLHSYTTRTFILIEPFVKRPQLLYVFIQGSKFVSSTYDRIVDLDR